MKSDLAARIGALVGHRYPAFIFRIYIGGLFIYAGLGKINYAAEFAESIAGYQIVPFWGVNLLAITLPWAELICGFLMIIGVRAKSAAAALAGMLAVFTVAIAFNLLRGTPMGCGCFSNVGEPMNWFTVLRDLIWLAMTLHVYFFDEAFQLEKKFIAVIKDI